MNRAVLFDLDGTLVRAFPEGETTRGPRTISELEILPDTKESIRRLRDTDYLVIAATNKPDIARGQLGRQAHDIITLWTQLEIGLLQVYTCPHQGEWCACRKPRAGLIIQAAVEHELDLSQCWLIGDRETDREAAIRAGIPQAQAIKIETNQGIRESVDAILAFGK